jgi:hypothetical protein
MARVLLGGIAAGIVVFIWGAVAHMALPIGEMGIRAIPHEESVIGALELSIQQPGFYLFPYMNPKEASEEAKKAWSEKLKKGPAGILVIHPEGSEAMSPRQLSTEVATDVVAALLAALLLSQVRPNTSYWGRVGFVTLLGIFAFVTISIPYWNWYGFPTDFTTGQAIDQIVGWFLAGLVLAAIVRPSNAKPTAEPVS